MDLPPGPTDFGSPGFLKREHLTKNLGPFAKPRMVKTPERNLSDRSRPGNAPATRGSPKNKHIVRGHRPPAFQTTPVRRGSLNNKKRRARPTERKTRGHPRTPSDFRPRKVFSSEQPRIDCRDNHGENVASESFRKHIAQWIRSRTTYKRPSSLETAENG